MNNWIVSCKQVCHPFAVITKKVEADTADAAMKKVNRIDDEYAAVSVRVDYEHHTYDQRAASL